jgi:Domain of unknown function (DUF6431)
VVLFVVDPDAAKLALGARMIGCPKPNCPGRLRPWSSARPRTVIVGPGEWLLLVPDRGMCKTCATTHTLLPAWYVPRRSFGAEFLGVVISAAVNHGHRPRRIAEVLRLPQTSVRRWVHGLVDAEGVLAGLAAQVCTNLADAGLPIRQRRHRPASTPATQAVSLALDELAYAATALTRPDPPNNTNAPSGVDYIHLLGRAERVEQNRRLRLVDPTGARPRLSLWAAINLAAGGRLLSMIASGTL